MELPAVSNELFLQTKTKEHPNGSLARFSNRQVTLVDIARLANVSPATVSRVINRPGIVRSNKVRAVRRAMEALHYTPPPLSNRRGPKTRLPEPKVIGIWSNGADLSEADGQITRAILKTRTVLAKNRVTLKVFHSRSPDEVPAEILGRRIEGVILLGAEPTEQAWHRLRGIPNVRLLARESNDYPGDFVESDEQANGRMAADYLKRRGHRQAATVSTGLDNRLLRVRREAFHHHCADSSLQSNAIVLDPGSMPGRSGDCSDPHPLEQLSLEWVLQRPLATGLYLPTQRFLTPVLGAAARSGLKPGTDFEIVLADRLPSRVQPSGVGATIVSDSRTLIDRAIGHLLWRIENFETPSRIGIMVEPGLNLPDIPRARWGA